MAGPHYNSPQKFPSPYLNDCKQDNSVMEYIDMDKTGIGARASGLPKGDELKSEGMTIAHVGGSAGKGG